jgi:hypothetical protein
MKLKSYTNNKLFLLIFVSIFFLFQGCVAINTYPAVARAGDTITLSLGSVDGLDKSKLQISFVPQSTGLPIDLTANIRSVLKIYPDRTSPTSIGNTSTFFLTSFSGHAAWMNIAVIDLPANLPIGQGYFQVVYSNDVRVPNTIWVPSAEGMHIATEIIAGTGTNNSFSYYSDSGSILTGAFSDVESLPHVVLRPASGNNYNSAIYPAAAEYRIRLPISGNVSSMDDSEIHVIWDYKPNEDNRQIQLNWRRQSDVITVNVLVPTDLTISDRLYQFSIVVDPVNNNVIDINGTPQLLSYRYFDLNGNQITSIQIPEVVVMK